MKISRFVTLVFVAASLLVGGVHLSHQRGGMTPSAASGTDEQPMHYFIAGDRAAGARIDCQMKRKSDDDDIWARDISPCWLAEGWPSPQVWGSWAMGMESRVVVNLQTAAARTLEIKIRANRNLPPDQKQSIRIRVNDHDLGSREVARQWTRVRFEIPEGVLRIGPNSLSMTFDFRISPSEAGKSRDHLATAAGISELTLMAPLGVEAGGADSTQSVNIWDADRKTLLIAQPGVLVLPLDVPPGTARLEFDLRASMSVDSSDLQVELAIEDLDGGSAHNSELVFPPGRGLTTARLPAQDLAGRWALMTVTTNNKIGSLEFSNLRFVPEDPGRTADVTPPPPEGTQPKPDIVLITLDAARAGHFSFAGHPRETTPFIDEVARESLVFKNAYALVPYTLCSVPTMITGLSFLDHRVVRHEDVLSQDAVTLAESLQHVGYHTACFSATPNNSKAKGFDQGYDVFREIWTEGKKRGDSRRAHFIAQRVVQWLDTLDNDTRPLHLQVHMVPPHSPYDPLAAFDRFTDPAYDGPCDGYRQTTSALDGGSMEPTPECLDHLLALYDGNLREADDAVRIIVDALRSRPTWSNTVVLITSDHGEAFMEHGRMGHNSTLFSEMLHVPFVLRMPPDFDRSAIDTNRMVTLADITPTLLSAAGLAAPHSADRIDLLTAKSVPSGRHMVTRTATFTPLFGIRTLRSSLMFDGAGSGALFDLATDSHERYDIHTDRPATYIGLGMILATRMAMPAQLTIADGTADITEEERALLETLGYIRD